MKAIQITVYITPLTMMAVQNTTVTVMNIQNRNGEISIYEILMV
jgi:hypothetical protein